MHGVVIIALPGVDVGLLPHDVDDLPNANREAQGLGVPAGVGNSGVIVWRFLVYVGVDEKGGSSRSGLKARRVPCQVIQPALC